MEVPKGLLPSVEGVIVLAVVAQVLVIAGVVDFVTVDVLMARAAVHGALSCSTQRCPAYGAYRRAHGPAGNRAHNTAGHGAGRGGPACGGMLLIVTCQFAVIRYFAFD
jgi:hypothetical protein